MDQRIGKQGGYIGLIVILIAILIVAWLAKDALKAYGLFAPAETVVPGRANTPAERARAAGAVESSGSTRRGGGADADRDRSTRRAASATC